MAERGIVKLWKAREVPGGALSDRIDRVCLDRVCLDQVRVLGTPGICGSGPGALRSDLGPAGCGSSESRCLLSVRAPSRVTPADQPTASAPVPRALDLAPSGGAPVRHTTPWPSGVRRLRGSSPVGRPVVDAAEPTRPRRFFVNSPVAWGVSANQQVSAEGVALRRQAEGVSFGRITFVYITRPAVRRPLVRRSPSADRPGLGSPASDRAVPGCPSASRSTSWRRGCRGSGR